MSWDKITEKQNPVSEEIDQKTTRKILEIINNEDTGVATAVAEALPNIQRFTDALVIRFQQGGKLYYIGSGTSGRLGVLDAAECPPTYRTNPAMVQGIIAGGYDALIHSLEGAEDIPDAGAKAVLDYGITEEDVVLGITACNSTPFVLGALKKSENVSEWTLNMFLAQKPSASIASLDR